MLIQLRDGLRNSTVLKYVFVGVIAVPFALFGVGSYFTAAIDTDAATVNGEEVSLQQFESALLQQQDRVRQMFGGKVPPGLLENPQMRESALEQLIQRQLMVQRVQQQHYTVSDAELAKAIRERDEFQVDGVFDQARYEQILSANRMSHTAFEEITRRDQGLVQLFNAITGSAFALPAETALGADVLNQEREFRAVEIDVAALAEALEVSDEELQQRYSDNESRYMRPPQYRVSYLELDGASLGAQVEIDDEAIEAEYESRRDEFTTAERRDAAHILLALDKGAEQAQVDEVMAKANELRAQLEAGADFAALAKEHSTDPGSAEMGGSLGLFGRGAMVKPFEDAAFALAVDEVSEPVRSDFGVHLIKLNAIEAPQGRPLDEVREQLRAELVERQVSSDFFESQETLAAETFENGGSLQPAADALGLTVQQSEWFSDEVREGIGRFAQVRDAVTLDDVFSGGLNSSVLEIADDHVIVLRLDDSKPEELKPLDEVREQIVDEIKRDKAQAQAGEQADALLAAVRAGEAFEAAASAQALTVGEARWSGRNNPEVDRAIVAAVFSLPRVAQGEFAWDRVAASSGNPAVVELSGVRVAEGEARQEVEPEMLARQAGDAAFQALQQGMREVAEVSINERALNPAAE